ncbi:hypothetical protein ACAX43_28565 [Paraburkholderia sp. IW21]|uniref:hypothetical protein n=1 Tax=Paraburkholderia sp. IW21 TaxID=3242488 RepID=UPI003522905B
MEHDRPASPFIMTLRNLDRTKSLARLLLAQIVLARRYCCASWNLSSKTDKPSCEKSRSSDRAKPNR